MSYHPPRSRPRRIAATTLFAAREGVLDSATKEHRRDPNPFERLALQLATEVRRYKIRVARLEAEVDGWRRAMASLDGDAPDDGRCQECAAPT